jgi:prephenate dehydrogenase
MSGIMFKRVALIGIGLIGSSISHAMPPRRSGWRDRRVGIGAPRRAKKARGARTRGEGRGL